MKFSIKDFFTFCAVFNQEQGAYNVQVFLWIV